LPYNNFVSISTDFLYTGKTNPLAAQQPQDIPSMEPDSAFLNELAYITLECCDVSIKIGVEKRSYDD
jgi:hypothetical protein